jgi:hypothetical protein
MILEAFKSRVRDYRRSELLRGSLFICLLSCIAPPVLFVGFRADRVGFDGVSAAVIAVSFSVIGSLLYFVVVPMRRKRIRELQGECSVCGRLLLGKHSTAVVTTGRCPNCGSQVL